jgi:hypothetical protein
MRIPATVSLSLIIASAVVSVILWRQLHAERQLSADLQTQLADAKTALATRPQPQPVVAAIPQAAPAASTAACPPTDPEKPSAATTAAAVLADSAKRQKALLENSEFRKARIAEIRGNMQLRLANMPRDVGLSAQEAEAVFNILAESELRQESLVAGELAGGTQPDPARVAELERTMRDIEKQQKDALVAQIGAERANDVQDYRETTASRQRGSNLSTMLTQAGKPLTPAQAKSLTAALVADQRRQENEAKTLAASGQSLQQTQADRAIEGDRRVLAAAASFLDAQQIELIRARFEQVAARTRSTSAAQQQQQRAAEAVGQGGN